MRVVKPMSLGLLSRPFEFRRKFHLGVAVMAFMPLRDEPALLPETAMWTFLGETLPAEMPLDAGMPKQGAEFLAVAHAFAPGGKPVTSLRVGIQLGERTKTLSIGGDRLWDGGRASQPKPFTTMPIDWQHAYGGEGLAENPLGLGFDAVKARLDSFTSLPNVLPGAGGDHRRPASFGAIDLTWPQRAPLCGTHDERWLKEDFPGFARDIDWRFFNVAPADQQFSKALAGNESFAFENLHPERPLITGRLPGIAPRLFVTRKGLDGFEETALALTTVWFFPDRLRMVLIHHGTVPAAEEDASDIEHIVVGADPAGALRPAAVFQEAMRARTERTAAAAARALDDGLLVPRSWAVADPAIAAQEKLQQGEGILLARARARRLHEREGTRAALLAKGLDPEQLLPPLPPATALPTMEELPAYIEKTQAEAEARKLAVAAGVARDQAALAEHGIDLTSIKAKAEAKPKGPPKFSAAAMRADLQAQADRLRGFGVEAKQIDGMLADPATEAGWQNAEAKIRHAYRLGAHHQAKADALPPEQTAALLAALNAGRPPYDLHGVDFSGVDFSGRDLSGLCFDGANLQGCNFMRAKLVGAVLAHANLRRCNFDHADLSGANLGAGDLREATFRGAAMAAAILAKSNLNHARFDKSDLTGAELADAVFGHARFTNAKAPGLIALKLSLQGWHAAGMVLDKASFIECDLSGAVLHHASLVGASFVGCKLDGVNFSAANLSKAAFVAGCSLEAVQFAHATLAGTNFRDTVMTNSQFVQANMEGADFSGATLTAAALGRVRAIGARFVAAKLDKASLAHGNFMSADLARADLRGADLTDCGFYEANLARVKLDTETRMTGMQVKRMRHLPRYVAP